jgi:hypothetical protein
LRIEPLTAQEVADELQRAKMNVLKHFRTEIDDPIPLFAIGLTVTAWRNTIVEDAHAGPRSRFHDGEMFAANVASTRLVYEYVQDYPSVDWTALADSFVDPNRVLAGRAIADLLGKTRHKAWARKARTTIEVVPYMIRDVGAELALWWLVSGSQPVFPQGYPEWWGSPWWPEFVDKFTKSLTEDPPGMSAATLRAALLDRPEDIDPDVLQWCVDDQGMRFFFFDNVGPWAKR